MRDDSVPPPATQGDRPAIEMTWKVFGGEYADVYAAIITLRHKQDTSNGFDGGIEECLKRHIFRGLGSLDAATNAKNKGSLLDLFCNRIA